MFLSPFGRLRLLTNLASKVLAEVNSTWPNPRSLIALHSPNAILKTGLCMCPPEKSRDSDRIRCRGVRSLQSGLLKSYREKWASFAYFEGKGSGISLHLRLASGESVIRTRITVFEFGNP